MGEKEDEIIEELIKEDEKYSTLKGTNNEGLAGWEIWNKELRNSEKRYVSYKSQKKIELNGFPVIKWGRQKWNQKESFWEAKEKNRIEALKMSEVKNVESVLDIKDSKSQLKYFKIKKKSNDKGSKLDIMRKGLYLKNLLLSPPFISSPENLRIRYKSDKDINRSSRQFKKYHYISCKEKRISEFKRNLKLANFQIGYSVLNCFNVKSKSRLNSSNLIATTQEREINEINKKFMLNPIIRNICKYNSFIK